MNHKSTNIILKISLFIIFIISNINLQSQDVEHLFDRFKQKPLSISGGISANQVIYGIKGIQARRDPYTYFLSGNLNLSIFGWSVPFSASYSNEQFLTTYPTYKILPFNQYGLSPYYKWIKFHLGYRSMNFSPYTLNGRTFYGAGVELNPGIFRIAAMYGKFQNAIELDSINTKSAYKRMGYAFKFGIGKGSDFIDFIVFAAMDDSTSLSPISRQTDIKPMQNLIYNVSAAKNLFKKINFSLNIASSALTQDLYSELSTENSPFIFNSIFHNTNSTIYRNAIKSGLTYSEKSFSIGLNYERVDPDFNSLGTYYFNNDFENFTLNSNIKFLENKLNFAFNIGGEKNNLNNEKLSQSKRFVSSISSTYSPSARWNIALNYSNFNSYTHIQSEFDIINQNNPYENLDTLNFTQITQSAGLNTFILLGKLDDKEYLKSISFNFNYQKANEEQTVNDSLAGSAFYNSNLAFILSILPKKISISTSIVTSYNAMENNKSLTIGPNVAISKTFFDNKLKSMFSVAYNNSYVNNIPINSILSTRISLSYILKKKHNFSLNIISIKRFKTSDVNNPAFFENTGTLNYSYTF